MIMKYLLIALVVLVIVLGSLVAACDNPEYWEYEARMPANSKTEDLLAAESMLYSNGYKRVRIKFSCGNICYAIYATKKESEVK